MTSRSARAGLLLQLAARPLQARYVLLTGTAERQAEARAAATAFLPGADLTVELSQLPEGRLPAAWAEVKEILEQVARSCSPDVISRRPSDDAHQDHRTIAEIVPTVFRDQLCSAYEIPSGTVTSAARRCTFPLPAAPRRARSNCCTSASRRSAVVTGGTTRYSSACPAARHGVPRPLRRGI
jgi:LmbE family N-acetylglucosaminyl deacetylase